LKTVISIVCAI